VTVALALAVRVVDADAVGHADVEVTPLIDEHSREVAHVRGEQHQLDFVAPQFAEDPQVFRVAIVGQYIETLDRAPLELVASTVGTVAVLEGQT
jgi:hypothetical protein